MNEMYRLAVAHIDGADRLAVERQGRLLPLLDILTERERAGLPGAPLDVGVLLAEWDRWKTVLAGRANEAAARFATAGVPADQARFKPPIAAPGKLICIGSNFHDHIAEMKITMLPTYPYSFLKPAGNTLRGSGAPVSRPRNVRMMDWEAELAVIVGRTACNLSAAQALDCVAGYANFNDLSARDWLADRPGVGIDWVRHKAFDGFAPMGPYFLPAEFVPDPQQMPMQLWVNGTLKQDSNTSQMVFGVAAVIEHLSSIMTLEPGDIIATGTPAGVAYGRDPEEFLHSGDEVVIEIGALGRLVTPIA
jgi:2-keto-4-pentenoate hydratase/2-oxohepta-3-ene-1,7-dioic acid hydratase in catechol pathway